MKAVPDPRRATLIAVSLASALLLLCRSASAVPTMAPLPEFVATEGAEYVAVLHLDDVVEDREAPDDTLIWHVPAGTALDVTLTHDRHLVVRPPDTDWCGVEAIPIAVCNPAGACATQTLSFRVEPVPDAPIIDWIPSRVIGAAAAFAPLDLRQFEFDPDGDADLTWAASGGTWLIPSVVDGVLTVERRDPAWRGTEELELCLTDSTGRSVSRGLSCTVTAGTPVTLTFIPNRPILIERGETRVLIDGLLNDVVSLSVRDKERLARAEAPFDEIDLALATHEHYDHVTPRVVVEHLTHSSSTVFASLIETVDLLEDVPGYDGVADRVVAIPFTEGAGADLDVDGIHVTAFSVRHTGAGDNLAFLIDVGGVRILALGDAAFDFTPAELIAAYGWPGRDVDVALVPSRWVELFGGALVTVGIAPRFVVTGPLRECPPLLEVQEGARVPVVVCSSGETWIVPPRKP